MSDDRALSWSADRTLWVWDLSTGEGRTLSGHLASVRGATLMATGPPFLGRGWHPARVGCGNRRERALVATRSVRGALPLSPQSRIVVERRWNASYLGP